MSYLYAGILVSFIALGLFAYTESNRVDSLKESNQKLKDQLEINEDLRKKEKKNATEANDRVKQILIEKQVIEDEAQANRDCIANKSCGVKFLYKQAVCEPVHNSTTSDAGANERASQDLRDFTSWYVDLEAAIKEDHSMITNLQKDIEARSNPDYCKASK